MVAKVAKECTTGRSPISAIPAATLMVFCSAMPVLTKRSGHLSATAADPLLRDRSASRTTTWESVSIASSSSLENLFTVLRSVEGSDGFGQLFHGQRTAVPRMVAFHHRDALALDGPGDDGPGPPVARAGERPIERCQVVPVAFDDLQTHRLKLRRERLETDDVRGVSVGLCTVAVDD